MSNIQIFGKLCRECGQFVQFGEIDIPSGTPPSLLRAKLAEIGWQNDGVFCETPKCVNKIFGERDEMILKVFP